MSTSPLIPAQPASVAHKERANPVQSAARLKERVYVTFTALAVLMALTSHGEAPSPGAAALSLLVTTVGILLAGFAADLISHATVHSAVPTRADLQHMLKVSVGAFGAVIGPFILLGLAAIGVVTIETALFIGQALLIAALAIFGLLALRRMKLGLARTLLLTAVLAGIGVLAVVLEVVAHSL